jgi:hypothetical protein
MWSDIGEYWQPVFLFCAALLLVAAVVTTIYLDVGCRSPDGFLEIPSKDSEEGDDMNAWLSSVEAPEAESNPLVEDDQAKIAG